MSNEQDSHYLLMERLGGSPDYLRVISTSEPIYKPDRVEAGYDSLVKMLPDTSLPNAISLKKDKIKPYNLLSFPGTSAVIAPNIGNSLAFSDLHRLLVLGIDSFEPPPSGSGLNSDGVITALVRNNLAWTDPSIFSQLVQTAERTRLLDPLAAENYIMDHIPVSTLWAALVSQKALHGLDEISGGKLIEDTGRLKKEYIERAIVVNGDNGGGNFSTLRQGNEGLVFPSTAYDFLSSSQTNFVTNFLGAGHARSVSAACSGFGYGVNLAEMMVRDPEEPVDLAIVFSSYDGPTKETLNSFRAADMHPSDALPYLGIDRRGYIETQAAVAHVFVSRRFAEELGLDITNSRLVRSIIHDDSPVWGVKKGAIPEIPLQQAVSLVDRYYGKGEFTGTIIHSLHGANTLGAPVEIAALEKTFQDNIPQAHSEVTVTTSLMGHQYSPRAGISLGLLEEAANQGILWGLAPAYLDLNDVYENESQDVRRGHVMRTGFLKPTAKIIYDSVNSKKNMLLKQKAGESVERRRAKRMHLVFSSERIPPNSLLVASHQGLGGTSSCMIEFPIGE